MEIILIAQPAAKAFSGNPIRYKLAVSPYGPTQQAQDIRILVTVQGEAASFSDSFSDLKQTAFIPISSGLVDIDIQSIVDAYLDYFVPPANLTQPIPCAGQFKKFRIVYSLIVDGEPSGDAVTSDEFVAYKGGVDFENFNPDLFFSASQFFQDTVTKLYACPQVVTRPGDRRFLYILYPLGDPGTIYLKVDVKLSDQTYTFYTADPYDLVCLTNGLYVMPAGFEQLSIASHIAEGLTVVRYILSLLDSSDNTVAQSCEYIMDYRNYYYGKQLLFFTSISSFECLSLKGTIDTDAGYTRTDVSKASDKDYIEGQQLQAKETNTSPYELLTFKGNTGAISKTYLDSLRDLFLSKRIFELRDERLIPVKITGSNVALMDTEQQIFALEVEWANAFTNEFYTPQGSLMLPESCPALIIFNAKQVAKDKILIYWKMLHGYTKIKVTIAIGEDTYTYYYDGNSGIQQQVIPDISVDETPVTVTGYTVCDFYSIPEDLGPASEVTFDAFANKAPVAMPDTFSIAGGYTAAVPLGNVLANDYDPDEDEIACTPVTGAATDAGGLIDIDADGNVSYTPPAADYAGTDTYTYEITETSTGTPLTATAVISINVGAVAALRIYVQLVYTNVVPTFSGTRLQVNKEIWLKYFSNPACTTPIDISGLGLTINYRKEEKNGEFASTVTTDLSLTGSGTGVKLYQGLVLDYDSTHTAPSYILTYSARPGTGYTVAF